MRELKTGDKEIEIYRETNWKWMGDMKRETKAGREMGIGEHRLPTEARGGQGILKVTHLVWIQNSRQVPEASKKFPPPRRDPAAARRAQGTAVAWALPTAPSIRRSRAGSICGNYLLIS